MKSVFVLLAASLALSVGAAHNRKHKSVRNEDAVTEDYVEGDWPVPEIIKNFGVPQKFTANSSHYGQYPSTTPGGHHHGRNHTKSRSH